MNFILNVLELIRCFFLSWMTTTTTDVETNKMETSVFFTFRELSAFFHFCEHIWLVVSKFASVKNLSSQYLQLRAIWNPFAYFANETKKTEIFFSISSWTFWDFECIHLKQINFNLKFHQRIAKFQVWSYICNVNSLSVSVSIVWMN